MGGKMRELEFVICDARLRADAIIMASEALADETQANVIVAMANAVKDRLKEAELVIFRAK